jgi:hypothetical protein
MQVKMELFRGNKKRTFKFVIIQSDAIPSYLGYNIILIQKHIKGTASLVNKLSAKGSSIIESTHSINGTILC